jgi:hypothetical protein
MTNPNKDIAAIDLFIEDIKTPNSQIRTLAKQQNCNGELTIWQNLVVNYLKNMRETIRGESNL